MTLPHVATSAVWASAANRAGLARRNLDEGGWGQNTKEYDAASELTYMYQRWYDPALGIFTSTAPYPPMIEHPYTFAEGNPVMMVDPRGEEAYWFHTPTGPFGFANHSGICIPTEFLCGETLGQLKDKGIEPQKFAIPGGDGDEIDVVVLEMGGSFGSRILPNTPLSERSVVYCEEISGSDGKENELAEDFTSNRHRGVWIPFVNDCHNKVSRSVKRIIGKKSSPEGSRKRIGRKKNSEEG